jgi:LCP family protein required for cell wall assembly
MKKRRWLTFLLTGAGIILCAFILIVITLWNKPLGPSLDMAITDTSTSTSTPLLKADLPVASTQTPTPTATASLALPTIVPVLKVPTVENKTLCNGPSSMTILLIGSDERTEGYYYGLADSIRLVRLDFSSARITTLDIPRDLWVEIPGISDHYGIQYGKLNQAYFFGNPGMGYYDGPGEGPGLLSRTLLQNFGVSVDHYLAVDVRTFMRIIDAMGGIDIYISEKLDLNPNRDGKNPKYVLEAGLNHLDGRVTLVLAMNRYPTIFQRAKNQDMVLKAVEKKLLSPAILPKLPRLISIFSKSVQTDLSPNDISKLVCLSQYVTKENTSMLSFPEEMFTGEHVYDPYRNVTTYVMETDFHLMGTYFKDFQEGRWP